MANIVLKQSLHAIIREAFAELDDSNEPHSWWQPFANMTKRPLLLVSRLFTFRDIVSVLLLDHVTLSW
jgi:hypothetical protein